MGRQKLLLPVRGRTVIRRLFETLEAAGVCDIFVLVREDDERLRKELTETTVRVLLTRESTADMRHSVRLLLDDIERNMAPTAQDAWLLTPADHPVLSVAVVQALLAAWRAGRGPILVPTHQDRRGHPTLFGWEFAASVDQIPPDRGLNWLLERHAAAVDELPLDTPDVLCDLDTPEDYERLQRADGAPDSDGSRPR